MTRVHILLALAALATPALAAPDKTPVDKKVLAAYKDWLSKGRKAEDKKDFKTAVADFNEALKVLPEDATVLSELGWTLYQAHELKGAEDATRRSIAAGNTPNVAGASLYNLGRIREDLHDKAGAIDAYRRSLLARPNAVVRARLKSLDPKAAALLDHFAPSVMKGPFVSLEAYCAPLTASRTNEAGEQEPCTCDDPADLPATKVKVGKPFLAAQIVTRKCGTDRVNELDYDLAVQTSAGWFATTEQVSETNTYKCDGAIVTSTIEMQDGRLLWRMDDSGSCDGHDFDQHYTRSIVTIAGAAAAVPSATPAIIYQWDESSQEEVSEGTQPVHQIDDVDLKMHFAKDVLELSGKTTGMDKQEAADTVGKHTLVFP